MTDIQLLKKPLRAPASVAQLTEPQPAILRVAGSIPGRGTCLGWGPGPQLGV